MTDYTKTTDFAAKDSLPSGDSGKIIKGTEFETEFDNIATAIATKSNTASPTFTGTTTIPTVDINGGAIDAVTLGTNSAVTEAQVDNININGNTISSSDTNGNVNISPNGTGTVVINTDLDVDNINVNGNTVSSTDTNGNINLSPNGTGSVVINTDLDVDNINVNGNAIISTNTNGNIDLTPNGTGEVNISKVDIDSGAIDGTVIGAASAAAITGTTITGTSFVTSGDMTFGDNDKAVFGADSDLQIYHDGTNSLIKDVGAGDLNISAGNDLRLQDSSGNNYFKAGEGGSAKVYYAGVEKLATTSTGIDVTGTVTADGLTVNSGAENLVATFQSTDTEAQIALVDLTGTSTIRARNDFRFHVNNAATPALKIDSNNDISFYEDTGTTAKFFWDSSAESLGIGTTSAGDPITPLVINKSDSSAGYIRFTNSDATSGFYIGLTASEDALLNNQEASNMIFHTDNTERMRIDSSGRVGIGTSDPSSGTSTYYDDLVIKNDTSGTGAGITIQSNTTNGFGAVEFRKADGTQVGKMYASSADGQLGFETGGSERMRIDSSGHLIVPNGVTLGTAVGTYDADNTLDDYEEGTWTPVLKRDGSTNNATITLSGAVYVKIGRMVHVSFYVSAIDYSAVTDGTNAIITGLPFSATGSTWFSGSIGYGTSSDASDTTWIVSSSNGYFLNNNNSGFRNGTVDLNRGMFTITYQTS